MGRVIFNEILLRYNEELPEDEQIAYRNQSMDKGALRALMGEVPRKLGARRAAEIADADEAAGLQLRHQVGHVRGRGRR